MTSTTKEHLTSAIITFISTFLTIAGGAIVTVPTESWTQATIVATVTGLVLTAIRGAVKVVTPLLVQVVKDYFTKA